MDADIEWIKLRASNGELEAIHDLGALHATFQMGLTNQQSLEKAVEYYSIAADKGHPESLYDLAFMYLEGEGTQKDIKQAIKLLKKACEKKHTDACSLLEDIEQGLYD